MKQSPSSHDLSTSSSTWGRKALVFAVFVLAIGTACYMSWDQLTLDALATQELTLRELSGEYPLVAIGVAFTIYASITGLSLPGAAVLTLAYGWFFGIFHGVLLVSIASTTGAMLAFLLSRYLFRDTIQKKFGSRLSKFNEQLDVNGPFYLFALRLIPAVPFFVINAVMGLTPIKTRTFWWVSQLGMLPGTAVYVYAGSSVPSLKVLADEGIAAVFSREQMIRIVVAFTLLGLFPLVVRRLLRRFRPASLPDTTNARETLDANN